MCVLTPKKLPPRVATGHASLEHAPLFSPLASCCGLYKPTPATLATCNETSMRSLTTAQEDPAVYAPSVATPTKARDSTNMGLGHPRASCLPSSSTCAIEVRAQWPPVRASGGPQKVKCGPAPMLQPRLPSHGLHCLLSSLSVRLASKCSIRPLCCSLSSQTWARDKGLLGLGL